LRWRARLAKNRGEGPFERKTVYALADCLERQGWLTDRDLMHVAAITLRWLATENERVLRERAPTSPQSSRDA
jgi:hypothetical protein